jgi:hypothetical protein
VTQPSAIATNGVHRLSRISRNLEDFFGCSNICSKNKGIADEKRKKERKKETKKRNNLPYEVHQKS